MEILVLFYLAIVLLIGVVIGVLVVLNVASDHRRESTDRKDVQSRNRMEVNRTRKLNHMHTTPRSKQSPYLRNGIASNCGKET